MIRTFAKLSTLPTFEERYKYLKLNGVVGATTFGYDRYLNQTLYKSKRWLQVRDEVIIRDDGCDLGVPGYEIHGLIIVHHMNVLTLKDIEFERDVVFDTRFLISTTINTHNAIHYGDESLLFTPFPERKRNDTCPWL
jgi:hypothetical protein